MKTIFKIKLKHNTIISSMLIAITILTGLIFSFTAFAEEGSKTTLTVAPMSQKIVLIPGEIYEGTIKVINNANATSEMTYSVAVGPYTPTSANGKDSYGGLDVATKTNHNIMVDWTSVDKHDGVLNPNETTVLTYRIKVPKDAPAGAQYISILVADTTPTESNVSNGTAIESKVQLASIVYANVAGETIEKGVITENSIPTILTNNKLEATSMVRNDGNIYTDATYTLQVWPLTSDEELCTNEEKAETSMVLPNTERYHVQTCDLPAVGIFRARQVVKIFGEESVLEKTIFVCPVWLMILAIVIVVAIVIVIVVMVRKHKKSASQD